MKKDFVILVNRQDEPVGVEGKMVAHKKGKLHRAFSIFIFNKRGELLLQQRAKNKYHSPGLWTNTCCSHPKPGEGTLLAAHRRLKQEMGFNCPLKAIFSFVYKAKFSNGLTEHEYDHVFTGKFNGQPKINLREAQAFKWVEIAWLKNDLKINPGLYTVWFKKCWKHLPT